MLKGCYKHYTLNPHLCLLKPYPHFTGEEPEAQRSYAVCPKLHLGQGGLRLEPSLSGPGAALLTTGPCRHFCGALRSWEGAVQARRPGWAWEAVGCNCVWYVGTDFRASPRPPLSGVWGSRPGCPGEKATHPPAFVWARLQGLTFRPSALGSHFLRLTPFMMDLKDLLRTRFRFSLDHGALGMKTSRQTPARFCVGKLGNSVAWIKLQALPFRKPNDAASILS